jgi:hypothetical protein
MRINPELDAAVTAEAVRAAIVLAEDAHQLHYLGRTKIPHLKGILDSERAELQQMIWERFAVLNALAVGEQKPRWPAGSSGSHFSGSPLSARKPSTALEAA